jgi:hypothetical protein
MTIRTRTLPRTAKGERSPFWRVLVGIARTLLTVPERAEWFPPEVLSDRTDADGYRVLTVRASNARDLNKFTDGVSVAGRQIVCTRIGPKTWQIKTE